VLMSCEFPYAKKNNHAQILESRASR
jgi:hypothetical protein